VALSDVSLEVHDGELVSIIGPNGAGKTTLFNVITGFHTCEHGSIKYKGEDITRLSNLEIVRKGIVRTFQRSNFFPRLTSWENVMVPLLRQHGHSWNLIATARRLLNEKAHAVLEDVGLSEFANTISSVLPHGYQRRLELAIALANNPSLLFLDEPTAGMTVEESAEAMELVKKLNKQYGLATFFTEHDMKVVFSTSQRIMVLNFGKLVAQGTPDEIRANKEVQRVYLGETK
jgi:branched-chain amino acid transport system ATP-binding protein